MKPEPPPGAPAPHRALRTRAAAALAALCACSVAAQEPPGPAPTAPPISTTPAWRITPSVTLSEAWSDNVALSSDAFARHGWVSDLSPALRVERIGARARVFADYRVHAVDYSTASTLNRTTQYLDAVATVEPVEKWLFFDARASITQENRSPFQAAVAPDAASPVDNRVETRAFQLAPYVRGHMGGFADYQLRFNETQVRTDDDSLPLTRTSEWTGRIRSPSGRVGWSVDVNGLRIRNDTIGSRTDSRATAAVLAGPNPQLQFSAYAGREETDFNGGATESFDVYGAGMAWVPSPRTQLLGAFEKRFFGNAHDVSLAHRRALLAVRIGTRRDVTTFATQLTASGGSIQALIADLLAATIPDPVLRQAEARRRLEQTGVPTGRVFSTGFLTERPYVLRSDYITAAYRLPRDTFTLDVGRGDRRSLGGDFGLGDAVLRAAEDVRERNASVSWAHALTPLTSLTVVGAYRRTDSITTSDEARQHFFSVYLSSRLGMRTYASIGLRHTQFERTSGSGDYRENAIVGSVTYRP